MRATLRMGPVPGSSPWRTAGHRLARLGAHRVSTLAAMRVRTRRATHVSARSDHLEDGARAWPSRRRRWAQVLSWAALSVADPGLPIGRDRYTTERHVFSASFRPRRKSCSETRSSSVMHGSRSCAAVGPLLCVSITSPYHSRWWWTIGLGHRAQPRPPTMDGPRALYQTLKWSQSVLKNTKIGYNILYSMSNVSRNYETLGCIIFAQIASFF